MFGLHRVLSLVDRFVPIVASADLSAAEADELFRARVTVGFSMILAAMVLLMFSGRLLLEGTSSGTLWLLAAASIILVVLPFVSKLMGSHRFTAVVLVLLGLIVVPVRAWSTGGIDSAVMSWFAILPLVAWLTLGAKIGVAATALALAEAFLVAHPQLIGIAPAVFVATPSIQYLVLAILIVLIAVLVGMYEFERRMQLIRIDEKLSEIKVLSGLLKICSRCKKIHDDDGKWKQMEHFIDDNSEAQFSHGLCPECTAEAYRSAGFSLPT